MNLLQDTISKIKELDGDAMQAARQRLDNLTKPVGSLGMLEDMAETGRYSEKGPAVFRR